MRAVVKRGFRDLIDVVVLTVAFAAAWLIRFEGGLSEQILDQAVLLLPYVVGAKYVLLTLFGARRHSWRFVGLSEVLGVVRAMVVAALIMVVARLLAPQFVGVVGSADFGFVPFGVIAIDFALSTMGLVGIRTLRRMHVQHRETAALARRFGDAKTSRVVLIGAGRAGVAVARELEARPDLGLRAVAFVDDNEDVQGQAVHGIPIVGTTDDLAEVVDELEPDEAIITIAGASGGEIRRIVELCERVDLPVKIVPGLHEIVGGQVNLSRIRPVAIEDLLRRDPVELDVSQIRAAVAHEVVLVTGAGGSIGAELCRQTARFGPREIVLVERSEPALWAIHRELVSEFPDVRTVPAIADVCDRERIDQLLLQHRPALILHAAAHKHVPMMEQNPGEAIKNNVLGTCTVADLAAERDVARFVMVSTDKAVNPTSVMGASKRVAERYIQHLAQSTGRSFVSVRFGNVLGSNGSVVPIFQDQIADGGPVTVTHPDMKRYFMTIPEASQLVLQAGAMGQGGEIFILDMGEPVRIADLAEDLIRLSGFTPHQDIAIEYTGLRPGEKLFEELSLSEEDADRTRHPKIWIGRHAEPAWHDAERDLERLRQASTSGDPATVLHLLLELVPEYTPDERTTGSLKVLPKPSSADTAG